MVEAVHMGILLFSNRRLYVDMVTIVFKRKTIHIDKVTIISNRRLYGIRRYGYDCFQTETHR